MIEIETKIRINDIKKLIDKIISEGAILDKERHFEENTLYDFSSHSLFKKQHALRLRKINKKIFITFKGSKQKSRKFKIREEYETEVKNEKQMKKIFKSLGLIPVFNYNKFRTVYRKKHLKICLDESPVGNFMELEGQRNDIVKFSKALGFSKKEFIKLDYIQLIKNSGKIENLNP